MKRLSLVAAMLTLAAMLFASPATATTLLSVNAGNDDLSVVTSLVSDTSQTLVQIGRFEVDEQQFLGSSFDLSGSATAGQWSIEGFTVLAAVFKASNEFILVDYTEDGGVSADNWCVDGSCAVQDGNGGLTDLLGNLLPPIVIENKQGRAQALSHITLYGFATPVPEAATWLMMLAGFALGATLLRRRPALSLA